MKKFLEDLKNELTKQHMLEKDINEIIADHEEMIQNAMLEGLSEEEMKKRFGDPVNLAKELASFSTHEAEPFNIPEGYLAWKNFSTLSSELKIKISLVAEDISVVHSQDEQIHVHYSGKGDISKYTCTYEDNELVIEAPKMSGFIFMKSKNDDIQLILEIPKSLVITNFQINIVSGDLYYANLNANTLTLSTTSGDVTMLNAKITTSKWNTVSGDLMITDVKLENLNSSQVSGDMHMKKVYVGKEMKLNTVSGDIRIEDSLCQDCALHSVSGDITGMEFYPSRVSLKSVSGDITIKNKNHTDIEIVSKSTLTGDIHIQL
ncbi:MAG: hypothetical protein CVV58_00815 [Tenericutes bacterium HGW-Tenericutes-3]|nr:MAG: hypothetical protein CVV58_00815 [Tenericutes bacterium HGW-Tenericutes-3]